MRSILQKELQQFFSSLTGYLAIAVFLILMGLLLFVFPETSLLENGFATLDNFFELAPLVLLLLVPAITMRSFSDEFKSGTYELLKTKPISSWHIILGKYWAAFIVGFLALIPTLLYAFTINHLVVKGSIDTGGIAGNYVGLFMLLAVYTSIGICCSSLGNNAMVSFLISAMVCFIFYNGFQAISSLPTLKGNADYYVEQVGIQNHYRSMSRGLLEAKDVVYFIVLTLFFLLITLKKLMKK